MSFHRPISRRTMLRGAGAAVCLPLLDVMGSQSAIGAAKAEKPVRLCYLYDFINRSIKELPIVRNDDVGAFIRLKVIFYPLD